MTSPKFSADKFAAKNDLKRSFSRLVIPSIISFLLSFYLIFICSYDLIRSSFANKAGKVDIDTLTKSYRFVLFAGNLNNYIIVPILMIVVGVLFAFVSYYQLMRKNCVNFFFSSAIDRKTYFKNRAVASISLMALTAFVPVLCDVMMNIHYFSHADVILYQGLLLFLEHFVNMLIGFSLMSVSMAACYTITESVFLGAGIIWFPTLMIYTVNYVAQIFLRGYDQSIGIFRSSDYDITNILLNDFSIVNPVLFGKSLGNARLYDNVYYACYRPAKSDYSLVLSNNVIYDYSKSGIDYILPIIIWIAISLVFILVAEKLILNRKLENTALHASRPSANSFVAFEASTFAIGYSLLFGNDIEALAKNKFVMVILALIIGFAIYFAFMSISRRNVKHSFKLLVPGIASVVICSVAIVVCNFGAFGYATYVPNFDKIEFASVTSAYLDATGSMSDNSFYENSGYDGVNVQERTNSYIGKFTTKDSIEKISEIQKYAYENVIKVDPYSPEVTVIYHLKSGKDIKRVFYNTDVRIQDKILDMTETEEYRDELEFLMSSKRADEKESGKYSNDRGWNVNYFSSFDVESDIKYGLQNARTYLISNDAFTKTEIENTPALRDAILSDIENIGYKKLFNSKNTVLGAINFKYDDAVKNYKGSVYASDNSYYIFDNMTSTIAYLKSVGKLDALNDTSSTGKLEYVIASKLNDVVNSFDDWATRKSFFESRNINVDTYFQTVGDDFNEKEFLETYNPKNEGKIIKNSKKAKELFDNSSIYSKIDNGSYILLFKYDNGIYVTRYLSKENAQKYLK